MDMSIYLRQVGALAVAGGVGAAIIGLSAPAAADTGSDRSNATDATDSARGTRPAPPSESVSDSDPDTAAGRGAATSHRLDSADASSLQKNRATPEVKVKSPVGVRAAAGLSAEPATVAVPAVAAATAAVADAPIAVVAAPVAIAVPAVTAVPDSALATADNRLLTLLGGDGSGSPWAGPLAWTVLAVTRRESASSATTVTPGVAAASGTAPELATAATTLGSQVSTALTAIAGSLNGSTGTTLVDFLNRSTSVAGVTIGDAVGIAAANVLRDAAGITRVPLPDFGAVDAAVITAIGAALSDPALAPALGSAVSDLMADLAGNAAVRTVIGDQVTDLISSVAGSDLISSVAGSDLISSVVGSALAGAVGDAVETLLASPALAAGLGSVASAAITEVLGQPAIGSVLADAVGPVLTAVLSGDDLRAPLMAALRSLRADDAAVAALGTALRNTLHSAGDVLTGSAQVQQLLAQTVEDLFTALTADSALRGVVVDQIGAVLGSQVAELLGDPSTAAGVATALGAAVSALLGQPEAVGALIDDAGDLIEEFLAGYGASTTRWVAYLAQDVNPVLATAVGTTISTFIDSMTDSAAVLDAIGGATATMVDRVLEEIGLAGSPVVTMVKSAVTALLDNTAVAALVGDVAGDLLSGAQVDLNGVLRTLITEPEVQAAVGGAVGQAIGSIFGDNAIGASVSWIVGGATTLAIGLLSGLALLFNLVPAPAQVIRNEWPSVVAVA